MRTLDQAPAPRNAGFSVIELTISLAVTVLILLAVLELFDFSSKISRVQTNVADMQQTQRVVHYELPKMVRMAGRGGLPAGNLPLGYAVSARDNVAAGATIGGAGTPEVVAGTDVLTIRGSFATQVYNVDYANTGNPPVPAKPLTGAASTVRIDSNYGVLDGSFSQNLQSLVDAVNSHRPEALLLISSSSQDTWVVVELDWNTSDIKLAPPAPQSPYVKLGYKFAGGTNTAQYSQFTSSGPGVFPPAFDNVSRVVLLEEYRYYLREEREIPGDNTSELVRRLTRAQTYLGTNTPYAGSASNWSQDIADNVLDLQFAYGVDTAKGGCQIQGNSLPCTIVESANGSDDDWLYNDSQAVAPGDWAGNRIYYVRMSTLVRTGKRDNTFQAPTIAKIENHDYAALSANTSTSERMFRRRVLQTVIDLRNL